MLRNERRTLVALLAVLALFPLSSCAEKAVEDAGPVRSISTIASEAEFRRVVESAADRLLIFDMYADWCRPCRMLTPTLEAVARDHGDQAAFYKINVDQLRGIAQEFGVSSIPFVVYMRGGKRVHAITGVQPKGTYVRAIERFAPAEDSTGVLRERA